MDIWQPDFNYNFKKKVHTPHSQALEKYIYSQINLNCKFRCNMYIQVIHLYIYALCLALWLARVLAYSENLFETR